MTGKIIKGIAGFYYVSAEGSDIFECKAKGIFRNKKIKPLVGDNVLIEVVDEGNYKGNIVEILARSNELQRPAVANIDQIMVVFAAAEPAINLNLLDRFLVGMAMQQICVIICINKTDIVTREETERIRDIYTKAGYAVIAMNTLNAKNADNSINSFKENENKELMEMLRGKTTAFAGPSGVGKSSILNTVSQHVKMETGLVSEKIKRGRHTTRHSELICIAEDTYIMDTPGFSSLFMDHIEKSKLKDYYIEFRQYEDQCRFQGCVHIHEPGCEVKAAMESGMISSHRYHTYIEIYNDLRDSRY